MTKTLNIIIVIIAIAGGAYWYLGGGDFEPNGLDEGPYLSSADASRLAELEADEAAREQAQRDDDFDQYAAILNSAIEHDDSELIVESIEDMRALEANLPAVLSYIEAQAHVAMGSDPAALVAFAAYIEATDATAPYYQIAETEVARIEMATTE